MKNNSLSHPHLAGGRKETRPSPPPAPKEAKQVPWSRLCSQGSVRMHWAPSRLKGWAAAPALNISPTDRHRALQLGVRKCLLVASLLRDITKCPGDSDMGGGRAVGTCDYPSPRTGSLEVCLTRQSVFKASKPRLLPLISSL